MERKTPMFFSLGGYTPVARTWADRAGVALFSFDLVGGVIAINSAAQVVTSEGLGGTE